MALSVVGMQGAVYISQFILAVMLPIEEFAIIRTVEASLQLLSSIAPLGISLLIVRLVAEDSGKSIKLRRDLSSYLIFAFISGLAFAVSTALIILNYGFRPSDFFLGLMAGILVFSTTGRTALNYLYGRQKFGTLACINLSIAIIGLIILMILVRLIGIDGWVFSRYFIEIAFLLAGLIYIWPQLGQPQKSLIFYREVFSEGVTVSLSLLFRTAMDTLPLLILSYISLDTGAVSTFGLCTLVISAALVLPASINTVLLPRYSQMKQDKAIKISDLHSRYQLILLGLGLIISITISSAGFIFENYWTEKFQGGAIVLSLLSITIPLKIVSSLNANVIFLYRKTYLGVAVQAFAVILSVAIVLLYKPVGGSSSAILAVLISELISTLFLFYFANRIVKYN